MPTPVTCPNPACARRSTVPDGIAGRAVKCPACGTRITAGSGPAPAPTATHSEQPGAVGRFIVRGRLGAGAFGTVYRAYDPHLDREVALKVPNPGSLDSPKRVERFLREAKAAANLRHPHVVPVYDAGRDGDRYFIASAFVDGKPLSAAIDDGAVDVARAARLTRELAEALAYAHGEGVVHRDVKPANVMLDAADRVHLMDFGLASRRDEESRLTNDGAVMGTPAYMAPEQAAGQQGEAQPAADQYACGVVLYELLTGKVPFEGPLAIVIHNQIHTEPDRPSSLRAVIPPDLETICLKSLAKRPEDRYPDCQAMADDLRRWAEGEPIRARRLTRVEELTRWARKNKTVAGLAGALAVALVVGTTVAVGLAAVAQAQAARADRAAADAWNEAARADGEAATARAARADAEAAATAAKEAAARADAKAAEAAAGRQAAAAAAEAEKRSADVARAERAEKERQLARTDRALYAANLAAAQAGLRSGQLDLALRALAACPADLRGWEYDYLRAAAWAVARPLGTEGGMVGVAPNGQVGTTGGRALKVWDVTGTNPRLVRVTALLGDAVSPPGFDPTGGRVAVGIHGDDPDPIPAGFAPPVPPGPATRMVVLDPVTGKEVAGHRVGIAEKVASNHPPRFTTDGAFVGVCWGSSVQLWPTTAQLPAQPAASRATRIISYADAAGTGMFRGFHLTDGKRVRVVTDTAVLDFDLAQAGFKPTPTTAADLGRDARIVATNPDLSRVVFAGSKGDLVAAPVGGPRPGKFGRMTGTPTVGALSANNKLVGFGHEDGSVEVTEVGTGRRVLAYQGHASAVNSLAFTPDGKHLVTGGDDRVLVWGLNTAAAVIDPDNGTGTFTLRPDGALTDGGVRADLRAAAAISPDGRYVAASLGRRPAVWDAVTGEKLIDLGPTPLHARVMAFRPGTGELIVCESRGAQSYGLTAWDAAARGRLRDLTPAGVAGQPPAALAFSPDGAAWADGRGRVGKTDGWVVSAPPRPGPGGLVTPRFHPTRAGVVIAADAGAVEALDRKGDTVLVMYRLPGPVSCLDVSADGRLVAAGTEQGHLGLFDAATGKQVHEFKGHAGAVRGVAFLDGGRRVASAGLDRSVRIWDVATGEQTLRIDDHQAPVVWLGASADGSVLASAGADGVRVRRTAPPPAPDPRPKAKP